MILIPCVPDSESAGKVEGAVSILDEVGAWNIPACDLHNGVNGGCAEQQILCFFELDLDIPLTKGNGCGRESVVEVLIEPE